MASSPLRLTVECILCGKIHMTMSSLFEHISCDHRNTQFFICHSCPPPSAHDWRSGLFSSMESLSSHFEERHTGPFTLFCSYLPNTQEEMNIWKLVDHSVALSQCVRPHEASAVRRAFEQTAYSRLPEPDVRDMNRSMHMTLGRLPAPGQQQINVNQAQTNSVRFVSTPTMTASTSSSSGSESRRKGPQSFDGPVSVNEGAQPTQGQQQFSVRDNGPTLTISRSPGLTLSDQSESDSSSTLSGETHVMTNRRRQVDTAVLPGGRQLPILIDESVSRDADYESSPSPQPRSEHMTSTLDRYMQFHTEIAYAQDQRHYGHPLPTPSKDLSAVDKLRRASHIMEWAYAYCKRMNLPIPPNDCHPFHFVPYSSEEPTCLERFNGWPANWERTEERVATYNNIVECKRAYNPSHAAFLLKVANNEERAAKDEDASSSSASSSTNVLNARTTFGNRTVKRRSQVNLVDPEEPNCSTRSAKKRTTERADADDVVTLE